jgi:hypothetical protein
LTLRVFLKDFPLAIFALLQKQVKALIERPVTLLPVTYYRLDITVSKQAGVFLTHENVLLTVFFWKKKKDKFLAVCYFMYRQHFICGVNYFLLKYILIYSRYI